MKPSFLSIKSIFSKYQNIGNMSSETVKVDIWAASWLRPAKTQISLGIRPVWSESSLWAQWEAEDSSFLHVDSEDSDQTWRMLIFTRRTCHFVDFVVRRLIQRSFSLGVHKNTLCYSLELHSFPQKYTSRSTTKPTKWCAPSEDSAWASTQSDQRLRCPHEDILDIATHWAHSEDSDQTGRRPRLIWVFAGRTSHFVGFVMHWLICHQLLSRRLLL